MIPYNSIIVIWTKRATFVVFYRHPQNAQEVKEVQMSLKRVLSKEYGRNMDGFVHDFCVTVGADGTVSDSQGHCATWRVNSGDSDLGNELGVESAEEAAKSNA